MSEEMKDIPRRLRRFYRHGEPVPEEMNTGKNSFTDKNNSPTHEENEPWMNPREKITLPNSSARASSSSSNSRRNTRNAGTNYTPNTVTPSSTTTTEPKPGLFSRILNHAQQPSVTHVDKALGLHDKQLFDEKPPRASEQALQQTPPLPKTVQAQKEIQSALQEIRTLARNDNSLLQTENKKPTPLTSFHFTPAGEAPHAPQASETNAPSPAPLNMSPRERAEQRRNERNIPQNVGQNSSVNTPHPSGNTPDPNANTSSYSHVRRRMGQVVSESTLPESARGDERSAFESEKESFSKEDEDFKSLFGEKKKDEKKKKKNASEEDEDFSLDEEGDEELELFDDK